MVAWPLKLLMRAATPVVGLIERLAGLEEDQVTGSEYVLFKTE